MMNFNFPNMFFPFGMQMPQQFDMSKMPFGFDMSKMPFGFDMSKMPFPFCMQQGQSQDEEKTNPFGFDMSKMQFPFFMNPMSFMNQMPFWFDMSKMPFGFDMSKMPFPFCMQQNQSQDEEKTNPFGFDMSKMQFPFFMNPMSFMNQMPFQFDMSKMPFKFDKEKCPIPFDLEKLPIKIDFSLIEALFKMFASFANPGQKSEEGGENNGMPFQNLNIPMELIQFIMRLEMSPQGLEKLQNILDKIFEMYSKEEE